MIAARVNRNRPARLARALQYAGAVVAAVGLVALGIAGPVEPASAAGDYNQITGIGTTPSAVTVDWTQGLLGTDNKPLASPAGELSPNADRASASPVSPLQFMYQDFKNLKVTVSQTQNIRYQGITVSWTWPGRHTDVQGAALTNYLQLMECYGDASSGPTPENCEWGSPGLLGQGSGIPQRAGSRGGDICQNRDTTHIDAGNEQTGAPGSPSISLSGGNALNGCDPFEPRAGTPAHYAPPCDASGQGAGCDNTLYSIPFVPVDTTPGDPDSTLYETNINQAFNQFQTNEVQETVTGKDGTGSQQFEALTSIESQGLGCGELESGGQVRDCWLVVVPRGRYDPNGFLTDPNSSFANALLSSPLSAGNWAQRIQVRLHYAPDAAFCDLNSTAPTSTVGTQLISRAVTSWILALSQKDQCKRIFTYVVNSEAETTNALTGSTSQFGLGFTTIPIGTEPLEDPGKKAIKVPKMLYAPVAVSALGFGFDVSLGTGYITTSMKLTPELLAKALTQVYPTDLPDYYPASAVPPPAWAAANPLNISFDPEFAQLNNVGTTAANLFPRFSQSTETTAPLLVGDKSALIQQVWKWVHTGSTASAWLGGTADKKFNVTVDPDYVKLHLGTTVPANFPRAYAGVLNQSKLPSLPASAKKDTGVLLPPVDSFDIAASQVLTGTNKSLGNWNPLLTAPDQSTGWWDTQPPMPPAQRFVWGFADTSAMAAFGLIPASLCTGDGADGTGTGCVSLSTDTVAAALRTAKPDSAGLLHVDPAKAGAGGYPLVDVIYAAVPVSQSAAQLKNYADLISFATSSGQVAGSAAGNLPPGYLPLPANLRQQAQSVVTQLRKLAGGQPTQSPTTNPPTSTSNGGNGGNGGGAGSTSGITTGYTTKPGTSTPSVTPGPSAPATPSIEPPAVQLVSGTTPKQNVGSVRWAIIAVVLAGLVSAGSGILLRSGRLPRLLRPSRRPGGAGP